MDSTIIVAVYFLGILISFLAFIYHERTADEPLVACDNDDAYSPEIMVAGFALSIIWIIILPLYILCIFLVKIRIVIIAIMEIIIQIKARDKGLYE